MAAMVILYDLLSEPKNPSGSWVYTSGPTPAPAPPAAYDDAVDFEGFDPGTYLYTYTFTGVGGCDDDSEAEVTIYNYSTNYSDECSLIGGFSVPGPGFTAGKSGNPFGGTACPGIAPPTQSAQAFPSSWGGTGTFGGDQWYTIDVGPHISNFTVRVEVNGTPYGSDGLTQPLLALYLADPDCNNLQELCASLPLGASFQSQVCSYNLAPQPSLVQFLIRVAANTGGEGTFDLNITSY